MTRGFKLVTMIAIFFLFPINEYSAEAMLVPLTNDVQPYAFGYRVLDGRAEADQRNGVVAESVLLMIDTFNNSVDEIGGTGFNNCKSLDFTSDGQLLAKCQRPVAPYEPVLIMLDQETGQGTEIGPTGIEGIISDSSVYSDTKKFSYEEPQAGVHNLHETDTQTGVSKLLGASGVEGMGNAVFLWGPESELKLVSWVDGSNKLYNLDMQTGEAGFITDLKMVDSEGNELGTQPCYFTAADSLNSIGLVTDEKSAVTRAGLVSGNETIVLVQMGVAAGFGAVDARIAPQQIYSVGFIDLDSGVVTVMDPLDTKGYNLDGIAARVNEPRPIPTLSQWGLVAASAFLLIAAVYFIARKRSYINNA